MPPFRIFPFWAKIINLRFKFFQKAFQGKPTADFFFCTIISICFLTGFPCFLWFCFLFISSMNWMEASILVQLKIVRVSFFTSPYLFSKSLSRSFVSSNSSFFMRISYNRFRKKQRKNISSALEKIRAYICTRHFVDATTIASLRVW
jgi:hypothetical protein